MKRILVFSIYLLFSMFVYGQTEKAEVGGLYYNIFIDSNTAEVTYKGTHWAFLENDFHGDITIPDNIVYNGKKYNVVSIGEGAFYYCANLKSVSIPNSVESIDAYSFTNCAELKNIKLPDNLSKIGNNAFSGCKTLTSVVIPNSVKEIGVSAFEYCDSLISVYLSEDITDIPSFMFSNCARLSSVVVPQNIKSLGEGAFQNCYELKSVKLNEGLEIIGDYAFYGDRYLTEIEFPSSVSKIGQSAFEACHSLSIAALPGSLGDVGASAFNNTSLTELYLPEGISKINSYSFYNCSKLEKVYIPKSIKEIGEYAFAFCKELESIVLPEGLIRVGSSSFYGCENLTSIAFPGSLQIIDNQAFWFCCLEQIILNDLNTKCVNAFSDRSMNHAILYIPKGEYRDAIYTSDWYKFSNLREFSTKISDLSYTKEYLLMNNQCTEYLIYDNVNDNLKNTNLNPDIDENGLGYKWRILYDNGCRYLYNIGAQRYVQFNMEGSAYLTSEKSYIELLDIDGGFQLGGDNTRTWVFVENGVYKTTDIKSSILIRDSSPIINYSLNGIPGKTSHMGLSIVKDEKGVCYKVFNK